MKISLNWMKELIDLPWSADQLPEKLASLGFPVESVERRGVHAAGVISVKILTVDKHPNADRLRIAKVTDGTAERTIVCGAPNIAPGQTVPLATPGAKLPGGMEITISKIRGVESGGMLCSERELGLSEQHAGILQLPEGIPLGKNVAEILGGQDVIYDVEVTPNRPDVLCHVGLARELAALAKIRIKHPEDTFSPAKGPAVDIEISEPAACHRYLGAILRGVRVGPSPAWMAQRLTACGIRSINNVVDITNYVLLEWGHPLHAFDLSKLKGPAIRVRRATAGEKFVALDEKTYTLTEADLVIADKEGVVALAGIMGGQGSGVTESTTDILLESAVFDRTLIRQTSRRSGLKSESSYRFEKGSDADTAEFAWKRAGRLITELAGGQAGGFQDRYPTPRKTVTIDLRRERLTRLLGLSVDDVTVNDVLARLEFSPRPSGLGWLCTPPPHRKDITEDADIAEEVIRLVGYDAVPASVANFGVAKMESTYQPPRISKAVAALRGYGVNETLTSSFVPSEWPARFSVAAGDIISLANPISQEESALRPYLSINLIRAAQRNLNHQQEGVALFEVGKTFLKNEQARLGLLLCGTSMGKTWQTPEKTVDIFLLKGLLEALGRDTGAGFALQPGAPVPFLHPHQSFTVTHWGKAAGWAGMVNPRLASELGLSAPCALGEMDLSVFAVGAAEKVAPIAKAPFVERDIAVVVSKMTPWDSLRKEAEAAGGALLTRIHPFDVFAGGSLMADHKSVAFRVRLHDPLKTLAEDDINTAVDRIKSALKKNCGAQLR